MRHSIVNPLNKIQKSMEWNSRADGCTGTGPCRVAATSESAGDGNGKIESTVESLLSGSLLLDGSAGFDELFATSAKINAEIT